MSLYCFRDSVPLWLVLAAAVLPTAAAHAQTPTVLLDRVFFECARVRDPAQQATVLADTALTAHRLGDPRWEQAVAEAVAAAGSIAEPVAKTLAWRTLAVKMHEIQPELSAVLLSRALSAARALPYAAHKALTLREIARSVATFDKPAGAALFTEARAAAEKIETPLFRAAALRDLAAAMVPTEAAEAERTFTQAAACLAAIQPPDDPVQLGRCELVATWAPSSVQAALTEAEAIPEVRLKETCYRRVVEALAPTDPEAALQTAARLTEPEERALALAAVAGALAAQQPETALGLARTALALGTGLSAEESAEVQGAVAVALTLLNLKESLELAAKIEEPKIAATTLGRIAVLYGERDPAAAAQIAVRIEEWEVREATQTQLAPRLAGEDMPGAMAMLADVLSRRDKIAALLEIIRLTAPPAAK